jgi:hypothetical protein
MTIAVPLTVMKKINKKVILSNIRPVRVPGLNPGRKRFRSFLASHQLEMAGLMTDWAEVGESSI